MAKILIIDDDEVVCRELRTRLSHEKYTVDVCHNGADGLYRLQHFDYDLAVVDWQLPDCSGPEICEQIATLKKGLPLLMLTSRSRLEDKVTGLDSGAMDYLVKPFSLSELSARIRALLRRNTERPAQPTRYADISVDAGGRRVRVADQEVGLSPMEFDILLLLIQTPGAFLDEKKLERRDADTSLKYHILNLRRKLKSAGSSVLILYRRPQGYFASVESDNAEAEATGD